jgi:alpha-tubulin suppressor-like RCC1 family protein
MPSGFKYPVENSDGLSFSSTIVDFEDVFVPQELFLNSNLMIWGNNANGELGTGNLTSRNSPVQVGSLTNWKQVSCGGFYTACVKTDGTLWTWGQNQNLLGKLGLGDYVHRSSPVQVGSLTNWKQVSCGNEHTAAIKTDGTLWLWGGGAYGELGLGNLIDISSPVQVGTLTNWKQVSCGVKTSGGNHTACVKTDGTLWTWGQGNFGQLGLGDTSERSSPVQVGTLTDWKQVSCGQIQTACVKTDGTLWTWGSNFAGALGLGDVVDRSSPVQVGTLTNWKQVSLGASHAACVKTDGTLWTWGDNFAGALGLENEVDRSSPVQVGTLTNWKQVDLGDNYAACVKTDGTLWTWGYGVFNSLGLGNSTSRSSPVQVGSLTNWKQVSAGYLHAACIKSDDLPI